MLSIANNCLQSIQKQKAFRWKRWTLSSANVSNLLVHVHSVATSPNNNRGPTEPFRDHLPLRSSVEMSPISNERVYPPKSHDAAGGGYSRGSRDNWLSRVMGGGSGSGGKATSKYRPLSSGEGDDEELRRLKAHEDGDGDEDEGPEGFEVVEAQRSGSGSGSRGS